MIGESGVGKSSTTIQFIHKLFVQEYDPAIEDRYRKVMSLDKYAGENSTQSRSVMLDILDTGRPEYCSFMRDIGLRHSDILVLMFDLSNSSSLKYHENAISEWQLTKEDKRYAFAVLVGNKSDLIGNDISEEELERIRKLAQEFKDDNNIIEYFEVFAKTGDGTDEMFEKSVLIHLQGSFDWNSILQQVTSQQVYDMYSKKKCSIM
eukprot:gb/GECH01008320.1/.p1 GENE.gb/GECH01008320.1/~~gb/GECH01008320.1/.p1  ORF type:complete len:206 (+),score=38.13 gb/GECH01008320.1/:1-618(+)